MPNTFSAIPDDFVAIGSYSEKTLSIIKERSGKFGMLELISSNPVLVTKLKKIGVLVGDTNPTILLPGQVPDDVFFSQLRASIQRIPRELEMYMKKGAWHIRGGSPGDLKGLVDVLNTPQIRDSRDQRDSISKAIASIHGAALKQNKEISYYADNEGVYWDPNNIQIGVVPTYDVPIVTATEDPNRDDRLFVDTLDNNGKGSNDRVMRRVEYTRSQNPAKEKSIVIPDLDDTSTSAQLRRALANLKQARQELDIAKQQFDARIPSPEGKDVAKIFALLKKEGILDPNMTYQLELGWVQGPPSKFILIQIKEFAKKNPINTDTLIQERSLSHNNYASSVTRIITGLKEGEECKVPIVDGQYRWDIWESVRKGDYQNGFAARPAKNSDDLGPLDYSPNMKVFFHGDAHDGTLAHNSFRFAQSLVRKGGTIVLGLENRPTNHSTKSIGMRVQNGILKLIEGESPRINLANLELPPRPGQKKKSFNLKK